MHTVRTIPGRKPNAVALGFKGFSAVLVTKGAKKVWDSEEMSAVMAHEQVHIDECHMVIKLVAMAGFYFLAKKAKAEVADYKREQMAITCNFAQMAMLNLISYVMERRADKGAWKKGHGPALAIALAKLPKMNPVLLPMAATQGSMHPTTASRVKRMNK